MFYCVYSNKDTTIYDATINGTNYTGSNTGCSEILEVFHLSESTSTYGDSRILLQFNLTPLSESIAAGDIPTSSVQYNLRLKNAVHSETTPYSYDLEIYPLSRSWDEGRGLSMFDERLKDKGVANWTNAQSAVAWSITGSDFVSSSNLTASQHFDYGTEDLNVNISNIVYAWLTGGLPNYGLMIKYNDFYATGTTDYYNKKFFSRHALVPERQPRIEGLWEKVMQDDRSEFPYNFTGSIGYYRFIGGAPHSIIEPLYVDILNSSSTVVQTLTASTIEAGMYEISGVFITPTASTQIYRDVWFTSGGQLFTGTFEPVYATGSKTLNFDSISMNISNLKEVYGSDEEVIIRVFAKKKDYKPAVVKVASDVPDPLLLKNSYFQIENAETKEVIIPFSTGTLKYSKLSYDFEGNYFKIWTSSLVKDKVYKIKILVDYNDKRFIFDKDWHLLIRD